MQRAETIHLRARFHIWKRRVRAFSVYTFIFMNHTYTYSRNYRKINFRMVSAQHFINKPPGPMTKWKQQKCVCQEVRRFAKFEFEKYKNDSPLQVRWCKVCTSNYICNYLCVKKKKRTVHFYIYLYLFSRRFYPKRLTIEEYNKRFIIKRQMHAGSACNTKFQALFRLVQARQGQICHGAHSREKRGTRRRG